MIKKIAAIILAAGQSTRMRTPKMLLPWRKATVLESVVALTLSTGLNPIIVVTGAFQQEIHQRLSAYANQIEEVYNPAFAQSEMFYSIKVGITALINRCDAAMIFLGDQPHVEPDVIGRIVQRFDSQTSALLIPSYEMQRGHPILLRQDLFQSVLSMPDDANLKTFLTHYDSQIDYILVDSRAVLEDMDLPEDYDRIKKSQTP